MINPRRRTAKARSSKPLLETDNVDQRVVFTIAILFFDIWTESEREGRNLRSTQSPVCCLTLAGKPAGLFQEMSITEWGLWIIQILSKCNLGPDHTKKNTLSVQLDWKLPWNPSILLIPFHMEAPWLTSGNYWNLFSRSRSFCRMYD